MIVHLANEQGTTVFSCTHQLRYAKEICTYYGLMDEGSLLMLGTIDELRQSVNSDLFVTIKAENVPDNSKLEKQVNGLYTTTAEKEEEILIMVESLVKSGAKLYHIAALRMTLEEIHFALIKQRREKGKEK